MEKRYSVLMSVYQKDRPEYLEAAIKSILQQTLKAAEFVLVCDGPLTDALNRVIEGYKEYLRVVRLPENRGLGAALAAGLGYCSSEWIARMDSDDIAAVTRCEQQLAFLTEHEDIDVLSGTIAEFEGPCLTEGEAKMHIAALKYVPGTHQEVAKYIKYRNPVNHPCVMFRKQKAEQAGGYQSCPLFEDYDLWVRMYLNRCRFANLPDIILYMRTNGMYQRRGGVRYIKPIAGFWRKMYQRRMISWWECIGMTVVRCAVSLCPNDMRKWFYEKGLRHTNI